MNELSYRSDHRLIIKRIIIRGILVLDTPTCLGIGDTDSPTDLPLLRDSLEKDKALLTGTSIAGALRNYLRERKKGYEQSDRREDIVTKLFGDLFFYEDEKNKSEQEKIKLRENDTQSSLIIDDAVSTNTIEAELRDGVKINSVTGTAEDKAKYDLELLQAGTEFPLCFELLIEKNDDEANLIKALVLALQGLEPKNRAKSGEICLGMKKRRGFGCCHVKEWQVLYFNLRNTSDRMNWLTLDHSWNTEPNCQNLLAVDTSVISAMKKAGLEIIEEKEDKREHFIINATFTLASPLLIRSGQSETDIAPDVVHLKSYRSNNDKVEPVPVVSGTSLAGVLRHRAERVVNTLNKPTTIVDDIFGIDFSKDKDKTKKPKASRLVVHESIVKNTTDLVQNRIAIDRFTGGAYHGALFDEQPVFAKEDRKITNEDTKITLELRQPKDYEIGLLLLLLKDLWTNDLPVGGGNSIGRGRLKGIHAEIKRYSPEKTVKTWTITQNRDDGLQVSDAESLESFVKHFVQEINL